MLSTRVIPVLLIKGEGLYKSVKFKNYRYVGDPVNAIKIFNEKEVDEIVILDVDASRSGNGPNYELIETMATQAFMPVGYGGGVTSMEHVRKLLYMGVEKIILNSVLLSNKGFVKEVAEEIGSQSVVACIDVKKNLWGKYDCFGLSGTKAMKQKPVELAREVESLGVGEIIINSIDRDGTFSGYDIDLVKSVSRAVNVPVVASGGAGSLQDFAKAVNDGEASAVAAGSVFVFHGVHKAVLITYPEISELKDLFN